MDTFLLLQSQFLYMAGLRVGCVLRIALDFLSIPSFFRTPSGAMVYVHNGVGRAGEWLIVHACTTFKN